MQHVDAIHQAITAFRIKHMVTDVTVALSPMAAGRLDLHKDDAGRLFVWGEPIAFDKAVDGWEIRHRDGVHSMQACPACATA